MTLTILSAAGIEAHNKFASSYSEVRTASVQNFLNSLRSFSAQIFGILRERLSKFHVTMIGHTGPILRIQVRVPKRQSATHQTHRALDPGFDLLLQ
jgi:hypothetical protein